MDSHNPCICRSKGALERRHIDDHYLEQHRQAEARDDPSLRQHLEAILNLGLLAQTDVEEVLSVLKRGAAKVRRQARRAFDAWEPPYFHR
jgi:hypothetical protein